MRITALRATVAALLGSVGAKLCWWSECLRLKNGPCPGCGCEQTEEGRCYACEFKADEAAKLAGSYDGGYEHGYMDADLTNDRFGI